MIQTAGFLCLFLSAGETAGQQVRPVNVSNGFNNPHKNSSLSLFCSNKNSACCEPGLVQLQRLQPPPELETQERVKLRSSEVLK